jgi:hypothetical protein
VADAVAGPVEENVEVLQGAQVDRHRQPARGAPRPG